MKRTIFALISLILVSCGEKDSDANVTPSNENPTERTETDNEGENEAPREIQDAEEIVISSILTELKMGLESTDSRVGEAMNFVNTEVCDSLKVYMENFGKGDCLHSCEDEKFIRNCSNQSYTTTCQEENYKLNFSEHEMSWDLSTISDEGDGISNYQVKASGVVSRNNQGDIPFSCDMTIKGRRDRTFSLISCGQSLDIECSIMGKDYTCKELLKFVERNKMCAKSM